MFSSQHTAQRDPLTTLESRLPGIATAGLVTKHHHGNPYYEAPAPDTCSSYVSLDFMCSMDKYFPRVNHVLAENKFFGGQIVVDLGAGKEARGFLKALYGNAAGYIAVEPNADSARALSHRIQSAERCWSVVVQEDMETFLNRLPDGSVGFIISAVSEELHGRRPPSFFQNVKAGLERSLAPTGSMLWYESDHRFLPGEISDLADPHSGAPILYNHGRKEIVDPYHLLAK